MFERKTQLPIPTEFGFPFKPYNIQADLMKQVFSAIENKAIGIFESPTGTGKTLTLTCSALTWLIEHQLILEKELRLKVDDLRKEVSRLEYENAKSLDWIDGQYNVMQTQTFYGGNNEKRSCIEYQKAVARWI